MLRCARSCSTRLNCPPRRCTDARRSLFSLNSEKLHRETTLERTQTTLCQRSSIRKRINGGHPGSWVAVDLVTVDLVNGSIGYTAGLTGAVMRRSQV